MDQTLTASNVRALLRKQVIDRDEAALLFDAVDPPAPRLRWRAFATHTLVVIVLALVALALGSAVTAAGYTETPLGPVLGAVTLGLAGIVGARRRAILPGVVALVVGAALVFATRNAPRFYWDPPQVIALAACVSLLVAWAASRTAPLVLLEDAIAALPAARHVAVRSSVDDDGIGAKLGAVAAVGALVAIGFGADVAADGSSLLAAGGAVLLVLSAIATRLRSTGVVLRAAAIAAGFVGMAWIYAGLASYLGFNSDPRHLLPAAVVLLGVVAVSSRPWRIALVVALTAAVMWLPSVVRIDVEKADDVVAVALAAVAAFALTRKRPPALAVGAAGALLLLSMVEVPTVGGFLRLNLGSAASLGAIACSLFVAVTLTRHASPGARALVGAVVVLFGALFINEPALLLTALVLVLARHAREPALEAFAAASVFAAICVVGSHAWDVTWSVVALYALAAAVVTLALLTLRRLATGAGPALPATAPR